MSLPGHVTIFKFGDINLESRYHEPCMKGQNGPVTHGDILSFFRGMVLFWNKREISPPIPFLAPLLLLRFFCSAFN